MSCVTCNKVFSTTDVVLCKLCDVQFCYECCGIDRAAINSMKKFANLCYFCNSCKIWFVNKDMTKLLKKIDVIVDRAAEKLDLIKNLNKIETEVAENRKLINVLLDKNTVDIANKPLSAVVAEPVSNPIRYTSPGLTQEVMGTGTQINSIRTVPLPSKKFLYISRFDPSVTTDRIVEYICDKLQNCSPEDVECKLLLSKDRVIDNSLTFISFKIGLKETHYNMLNNSEAWPLGVIIRPFTSYPRVAKNRTGVTFPTKQ